MPVKRLNFTNRTKLTREQANILIHPGDPASFEAALSLSHLPESASSARVFVEAYHRTTRMRFDFGTVAAVTPPPPVGRLLSEFDDWRSISFRVKVTDVTGSPGRILAWANNIHPKGPDDLPHNDLVRWKDAELDGRLWDILFDEKGPVVLIDMHLGHATVGQDPRFIAAAYPEILRRTLEEALLNEKVAVDDPDHWFTSWHDGYLRSKLKLSTAPGADAPEARRDWVEQAVIAFGRQYRVVDQWLAVAAARGAE
jgi:hypothetical protein